MKKDPSSPAPAPRKTLKPKPAQPVAAQPVAAKRTTAAPKTRARAAKAAPAVTEITPPRPRLVATTSRSRPSAPSPDAVAERAYEIFMARNWEHGHDLDDWLQAEAELANPKPARKRA